MRASVFLLAAASAAVASAETVEMFGAGGYDGSGDVLVFPLGSDATATTYLIGCPAATANEQNCAFLGPLRYTVGPSSLHMESVGEGDLTLVQDCALGGKTRAVCGIHYEGTGTSQFLTDTADAESLGTTTISLTGTAAETLWGPATVVTDVASIYHGKEAAASPAATGTGGSTAPATTGGAVTSAPTATPTGTTGTHSGAVETSQSTGGMPQITGSCGWAVGGVAAAAVALAAL